MYKYYAMSIVICYPRGVYFRAYWTCPAQKFKCRVVVFEEGWYGRRWHCCGCGGTWYTDAASKRPNPQGVEAAILKHKEMWKTAATRAEANEWLHEEMFG